MHNNRQNHLFKKIVKSVIRNIANEFIAEQRLEKKTI